MKKAGGRIRTSTRTQLNDVQLGTLTLEPILRREHFRYPLFHFNYPANKWYIIYRLEFSVNYAEASHKALGRLRVLQLPSITPFKSKALRLIISSQDIRCRDRRRRPCWPRTSCCTESVRHWPSPTHPLTRNRIITKNQTPKNNTHRNPRLGKATNLEHDPGPILQPRQQSNTLLSRVSRAVRRVGPHRAGSSTAVQRDASLGR